MSYVNRPIDDITPDPAIVTKATDYHDLVRWGPITGLVVALATQLILSALGAAIDRLPFRFRCTQIKRRWSWHRCRNLVNYQLVYLSSVAGLQPVLVDYEPGYSSSERCNLWQRLWHLALAISKWGIRCFCVAASTLKSSTRFNSKVASRFEQPTKRKCSTSS